MVCYITGIPETANIDITPTVLKNTQITTTSTILSNATNMNNEVMDEPTTPTPTGGFSTDICSNVNASKNDTVTVNPEKTNHHDFLLRCGVENCESYFTNSSEYKQHLDDNHPVATVFNCFHCGSKDYKFSSHTTHLKEHLRNESTLLFVCCFYETNHCKYGTNILHDYKEHISKQHSQMTHLSCMKCNKIFQTKDDLFSHLANNLLKFIKCPHCVNVVASDKRGTLKHISMNHPGKSKKITVSSQLVCKMRIQNKFYAKKKSNPIITPSMLISDQNVPTATVNEQEEDQKQTEDADITPRLQKDSDDDSNYLPSLEPVSTQQSLDDSLNDQVREISNHQIPELSSSVLPRPQKPTSIDTPSDETPMNYDYEDDRLFTCDKCTYIHNDKMTVVTHKKVHDRKIVPRDRRFVCPICPTGTDTIKKFGFHISSHNGDHDITIYKCKKCSYITNKLDYIKEHGIGEHAAWDNDLHMDTERYIRHVKTFTCDICNYAYVNEMSRDAHKTSHENDIICEQCAFRAKNQLNLDYHTKHKHTEFKCERCVFKAIGKDQLKEHRVIHSLEKVCEKCGFICKDQLSLDEHLKSHLKELTCDKCDFKTSDIEEHMQHTKKHEERNTNVIADAKGTKNKPANGKSTMELKCPICKKMFSEQREFEKHCRFHAELHLKKVPTKKCSYCDDYSTTCDRLMRIHWGKHHSDVIMKLRQEKGITSGQSNSENQSPADRIENKDKDKTLPEQSTNRASTANDIPASTRKLQNPFYIPPKNIFSEPIQCSECDYKTVRRSLLVIHIQSHSNLYAVYLSGSAYSDTGSDHSEKTQNQKGKQTRKTTNRAGDKLKRIVTLIPIDEYLLTKRKRYDQNKENKGLKSNMPLNIKTEHLNSFSLGTNALHGRLRPCFQGGDSNTEFICLLCSKSKFADRSDLHKHILRHYKIGFFCCGYCNHEELLMDDLHKHIKAQHMSETDQLKFITITEDELEHRLNKGMHTFQMSKTKTTKRTKDVDLSEYADAEILESSFESDDEGMECPNKDSNDKTIENEPNQSDEDTDTEFGTCSVKDITRTNILNSRVFIRPREFSMLPLWLKPIVKIKRLKSREKKSPKVKPKVVKVGNIYKCNTCGFKGSDHDRIKRHLSIHKKVETPLVPPRSKQHNLPKADNSTSTVDSLKDHGVATNVNLPSRSTTKEQSDVQNLLMITKTTEGDFKCGACDFLSNEYLQTKQHMQRAHIKEIKSAQVMKLKSGEYKCSLCDFQNETQTIVTKHLCVHDKQKIPCNHCYKYVNNNEELEDHIKTKHPSVMKDRENQQANKNQTIENKKTVDEKRENKIKVTHKRKKDANNVGKASRIKEAGNLKLKIIFRCRNCKDDFESRDDIMEHYFKEKKCELQFRCPICKFVQKKSEDVKPHMIKKHKVEISASSFVPQCTSKKEQYQILLVEPGTRFPTYKLRDERRKRKAKKFPEDAKESLGGRSNHIESYNADGEYWKCTSCPFFSERRNEINAHVWNHQVQGHSKRYDGKVTFKCLGCNQGNFPNKNEILRHFSSNEACKKVYKCPLCPFYSNSTTDVIKQHTESCHHNIDNCQPILLKPAEKMKTIIVQYNPETKTTYEDPGDECGTSSSESESDQEKEDNENLNAEESPNTVEESKPKNNTSVPKVSEPTVVVVDSDSVSSSLPDSQPTPDVTNTVKAAKRHTARKSTTSSFKQQPQNLKHTARKSTTHILGSSNIQIPQSPNLKTAVLLTAHHDNLKPKVSSNEIVLKTATARKSTTHKNVVGDKVACKKSDDANALETDRYPGLYKCNFKDCVFTSTIMQAMSVHVSRHLKYKEVKCHYCDFTNYRFERRHFDKVHPKKPAKTTNIRIPKMHLKREAILKKIKSKREAAVKKQNPTPPHKACSSSATSTIKTSPGKVTKDDSHVLANSSTNPSFVRRYVCIIKNCGKTMRFGSLRDHTNRHFNYKPFSCNDCDYTECRESNLKNHCSVNKHTYSTHYDNVIELKVKKIIDKIKNKADLKRQTSMQKTTPAKKTLKDLKDVKRLIYRCAEKNCNKSMSFSNVKLHMMIHLNYKKFKCAYCDLHTRDAWHVSAHQDSAHPKKPKRTVRLHDNMKEAKLNTKYAKFLKELEKVKNVKKKTKPAKESNLPRKPVTPTNKIPAGFLMVNDFLMLKDGSKPIVKDYVDAGKCLVCGYKSSQQKQMFNHVYTNHLKVYGCPICKDDKRYNR